jgi:hypothetical protein
MHAEEDTVTRTDPDRLVELRRKIGGNEAALRDYEDELLNQARHAMVLRMMQTFTQTLLDLRRVRNAVSPENLRK